MKAFWDARYDTDHFVYGMSPNLFFASEIDKLSQGKLLLPGEGEGRNAVYAAIRGWQVDAFDQSRVGSIKAQRFAGEMGVHIVYRVSSIENYRFPENHYDAVGLVFVHPEPGERIKLHKHACSSLKPGGTLILEGFHLSQLGNASGGPKSPELLFDKEMLRNDFSILEIIRLETCSIPLDEGAFHSGEAEVIRLIAKKHK